MYRLAAGLTQPQLVEKMEPLGTILDVAALSKVENGKARAPVSMRDVCAAAGALGIPLYELLLDEPAAQLIRTLDKGGVPAVQRWCADEVARCHRHHLKRAATARRPSDSMCSLTSSPPPGALRCPRNPGCYRK